MSFLHKGVRYVKLADVLTPNKNVQCKNRNLFAAKMYTTATRRSPNNALKLGIVGVTVGALVGTGYSINQLNKSRAHIINEETFIPIINDVPNTPISRKIRTPGDQSGLKLTLYQYQTCPFCCKVRAFLDYYGISYDVIEVDPVLRQSIKWSNYKKVPILVAKIENGYQPLNDSSMIISALSSFLKDSRRVLPDIIKCYPFISFMDESGSTKQDIMNKYFLMLNQVIDDKEISDKMNEERKWRKWADEVLVHTLSPNVYRTPAESLQAFNWFSEVGEWTQHFPSWEKILIIYFGAGAMWLIGKRLKTRHNLNDDVRQSLYNECNHWAKAVEMKGMPFLGGQEPNLADLAVYGILNSIEGCHAFQDLVQNSNIARWYFDMKEAVKGHRGSLLA